MGLWNTFAECFLAKYGKWQFVWICLKLICTFLRMQSWDLLEHIHGFWPISISRYFEIDVRMNTSNELKDKLEISGFYRLLLLLLPPVKVIHIPESLNFPKQMKGLDSTSWAARSKILQSIYPELSQVVLLIDTGDWSVETNFFL